MLRDIPRIYLLIFGFVTVIFLLVAWYQENFLRDSDVLQLNEIILTHAVTEVDHASRLYEGALLLADTFEPSVWISLEKHYPEGSAVQFEYVFDTEDDRFDNVESEVVPLRTYYIGRDRPNPNDTDYMTGRPIKNVRVKINEKGDKGDWTYVSTISVDAESRNDD